MPLNWKNVSLEGAPNANAASAVGANLLKSSTQGLLDYGKRMHGHFEKAGDMLYGDWLGKLAGAGNTPEDLQQQEQMLLRELDPRIAARAREAYESRYDTLWNRSMDQRKIEREDLTEQRLRSTDQLKASILGMDDAAWRQGIPGHAIKSADPNLINPGVLADLVHKEKGDRRTRGKTEATESWIAKGIAAVGSDPATAMQNLGDFMATVPSATDEAAVQKGIADYLSLLPDPDKALQSSKLKMELSDLEREQAREEALQKFGQQQARYEAAHPGDTQIPQAVQKEMLIKALDTGLISKEDYEAEEGGTPWGKMTRQAREDSRAAMKTRQDRELEFGFTSDKMEKESLEMALGPYADLRRVVYDPAVEGAAGMRGARSESEYSRYKSGSDLHSALIVKDYDEKELNNDEVKPMLDAMADEMHSSIVDRIIKMSTERKSGRPWINPDKLREYTTAVYRDMPGQAQNIYDALAQGNPGGAAWVDNKVLDELFPGIGLTTTQLTGGVTGETGDETPPPPVAEPASAEDSLAALEEKFDSYPDLTNRYDQVKILVDKSSPEERKLLDEIKSYRKEINKIRHSPYAAMPTDPMDFNREMPSLGRKEYRAMALPIDKMQTALLLLEEKIYLRQQQEDEIARQEDAAIIRQFQNKPNP